MTTHDEAGRPYAKLSDLKEGDTVEIDEFFPCAKAGRYLVKSNAHGLYFECESEGGHQLHGQADDGEHYVGVYGPIKEESAAT